MRSFLIILVLVLWCLVGVWFWQLSKKCCPDVSEDTTEVSAVQEKAPIAEGNSVAAKTGPLLFNWSDKSPIYGDGWNDLRDSYKSRASKTNNLLITGQYRKDEVNKTSFENLGMARADSIMKSSFADVDPSFIQLDSRLINEGTNDRNDRFESATFSIVRNTTNIKQTADRTLIYFPYNSTQRLNATDVDTYLAEVAIRVKQSGEQVSLTGHTDSMGDSVDNERLGLSRANIIKQVLVSKGVPSNKISVNSKGETVPVASNDTKEGRAQNRRTELQIKN